MADAFAPQFQGEVRFNQPVEQPSTLGAVADLVGMFGKAFSSAQEGRASTAPKTDPNLGVFRQGLERVEAIRQERGETAALVAERQLASNFAMAGINLDDNYKDVYQTTTGRTWAGYGADNEARIIEETLKDPQVQASYIASFAVNKDWSKEQRVEYAIGQKATLQAAENEIARSKAEAGYKWNLQTEAAYNSAVDTFLNVNLGALMTTTQQGGRVSPQDVANLSAQWGQLKVNVSRPPGVSDDQWKAIEDKIANVDNMLTTMQKAGSSEVMLETLTTGFANAMIEQGGGSTESLLAGMTALKDPATLTNLMGGKVETFIMGIGQNLNINIPTMDLFGHVVETQGGLAAETDPNAVITTIPENIKQNLDGKTPEQIYKGLEASGMLTSVIGPNDLSRPEARQQFVENATTIGAVLMNNPSDQFLSDAALKKLIANPQFIRNIQALEATDPEAYTVARQFVRGGLNTELARQQRNLEAIESNLGVTWNGSAYVLDKQALIDGGMTAQQADGFVAWVGKTYGGDLKALADGLAPMPPGMNFKPAGLQQAYDRRAAIGTIGKAMSALEVKVDTPAAQEPTAEAEVTTGTGYRIPEEVAKDTEFVNAAGQLASEFSIPVDDLFRVIEFETAGSWDPAIKNPGSTATGLIQFLESTAKGLGTSTANLANMTRAQQMEYVGKYLAPYKGKIKNFGDLYLAIHYPKAVGQSETFVMYSQGSAEYAANKNLDTNGDGTVTRGETVASVIARTGGGRGVMTTPATAKTGEFLQQATTDIAAVAPPGGFAPAAPVSGGGAAAEAPATATEAVTAELPVDFSNAATGVMPQQEDQTQAPTVDAEVQALIDNLSTKTKRQLKAAGIEPSSLKFFETDAAAEAAIESGELQEGDAYILPNGQVNIVEGD